MTDTFYTSAICVGSNILYRGIENGAKVRKKIPYKPTLYLPTRKASKFKTLQGETLEPRRFDTIRDARDFVKQFTEVQNFKIYGNNRYETPSLLKSNAALLTTIQTKSQSQS